MTTETKEHLFARLGALGFEKVRETRNRGILDGEPTWVYEWLEDRASSGWTRPTACSARQSK